MCIYIYIFFLIYSAKIPTDCLLRISLWGWEYRT